MRWLIYCGIGVWVHQAYWQMPLDPKDPLFWLDVFLWPFGLLYHWPLLLQYLPRDALEGLGTLIGVVILFWLVHRVAVGMRNDRRW